MSNEDHLRKLEELKMRRAALMIMTQGVDNEIQRLEQGLAGGDNWCVPPLEEEELTFVPEPPKEFLCCQALTWNVKQGSDGKYVPVQCTRLFVDGSFCRQHAAKKTGECTACKIKDNRLGIFHEYVWQHLGTWDKPSCTVKWECAPVRTN